MGLRVVGCLGVKAGAAVGEEAVAGLGVFDQLMLDVGCAHRVGELAAGGEISQTHGVALSYRPAGQRLTP